MNALGLALGGLIGLSLGLLGGGGSILTVPVLVYVAGFGAKQAIAMSLPVVGTTSLVGAVRHWRDGNVRFRTAAAFGGAAVLGAYLGAKLAVLVSGEVQLVLLAVVMLVAAGFMFRRSPAIPGAPGEDAATPQTRPLTALAPIGLGVGLLTGLLGIGGGFLIVPALVLLGGVPMKSAVGTSLLIISLSAATAFVGYAGQVSVPWPDTALFTAAAIAGVLAGAQLGRFVSGAGLRRIFALFLILVGGFVLYRNRAVFSRDPAAKSTAATSAMLRENLRCS